MNINASAITSKLKSLAVENGSSYSLIDKDMVFIGGSEADMFLQHAYDNNFIDTTFKNNTSGYKKFFHDNVESFITYITINNLQWKLIRITPYYLHLSQLQIVRFSTLIISIIVFVVAMFALFPLYKKASPFISNLFNKLKYLSELRNDNYLAFRQEMLQNLLLGNTNCTSLFKYLGEFDINFDLKKPFLVILVKIDSYQEFCNKYNCNDRNRIFLSIGNIANELVSNHFKSEYIQSASDYLTMILNIDRNYINDDQSNIQVLIHNLILQIQSKVKEYLDISISCIIGNIVSNYSSIPPEFKRILELSNFRLVYGHSSLLFASKLSSSIKSPLKYPHAKQKQLFEKLLLGKLDDAIAIYENMVHSATHYSYNDLMTFFNRLGLSINTFFAEHESLFNSKINFEFYEFTKYLNSVETIDEINDGFIDIFTEICDLISSNKEGKTSLIIEQVNNYIENNFQDTNLSLNIIAEFINKSPIYLGRLYKNISGRSVQDVINEVRLKKSIKMLESTQLTILDICSKIGIANEKYFYILFKKHIGLTPNEYRTRMLS